MPYKVALDLLGWGVCLGVLGTDIDPRAAPLAKFLTGSRSQYVDISVNAYE